jgi:hypothetical protein
MWKEKNFNWQGKHKSSEWKKEARDESKSQVATKETFLLEFTRAITVGASFAAVTHRLSQHRGKKFLRELTRQMIYLANKLSSP